MHVSYQALFFTWISCTYVSLNTNAEVFTAQADIEGLLETEGILLDSLRTYVKFQEERIKVLRRQYEEYSLEHNTALNDVTEYLANPINAFKLIKRLSSDWETTEDIMKNDPGSTFVQNMTTLKQVLKLPTDEDLSGAAMALIRLQDLYLLDTDEVSTGKLNGVSYSSPMSSHDCFELGRQIYNQGDYQHTAQWMSAALSKHEQESNKTVPKSDILEYLAFSSYMTGNVANALMLTRELLEIVPNHARAQGNIPHYEKALLEKRETSETAVDPPAPNQFTLERNAYEQLCRAELDIPESVKKDLKCRYFSDTHPFLKIAPMKLEQMYPDPYIVIYHDILREEEMAFIKDYARPRFSRATVQDSVTGELVHAKYRISKSAWLKDVEHPTVSRISQRVADMTGLSMDTAEELQVANYGIGGHYEPHFDFARKEEVKAFGGEEGNGNRIATVLFYMSDVAQGGHTVFPELGLSLKPIKGAGVFWLNLYPSGEGNFATRHAACPVLQGSKWVSNKWLHQKGQELLKPCSLEYQKEGIDKVYPKPILKSQNT